MRFKLGQKLILTIGAIIVLAIASLFWWLMVREQKIFLREIKQQARAYFEHVVLVRHWLADQGGIYVPKSEGVETNPYLKKIPGIEPEIVDVQGRTYTLKNPALATRELSEYAEREGIPVKFKITSLKLLNPNNTPDEFEKQALLSFEQGQQEAYVMDNESGTKVYRYMAPLYIKEACLKCHAHQGYKVGQVRGGISVTMPIQRLEDELTKSKIIFSLLAILITLIIISLLYVLVSHLISKPLAKLSNTTRDMANDKLNHRLRLKTGDEIEYLATQFKAMGENLKKSSLELEETNQTLEKTQQQLTHYDRLTTIGTVVAGVAHELRNPLANIAYELEGLKISLGEVGQEKGESFELLKGEIQRINQIIRQLQEVTRASTKGLEALDVNQLLKSRLFAIFFKQLKLKKIKIELKLDKNIPPIWVHKTQITQVLINLIHNAENAMAEGGKLEISTRAGTSEAKTSAAASPPPVEIEISDNGGGIPPDKLPNIFKPFFTTKGAMGSGLGLFISYNIIKEHQGEIKVKSKVGQGSAFIIKIPVASLVG